jgi:hypothetical protein
MIDTTVEINNAPVPITPAVLLKYLLPNNPSITKVTSGTSGTRSI